LRDGEMVHAPTAGRALGIGADRIFDRFGEGKKRDESIRMPKDSLPAGHGRVALTCLGKAAIYDDQSTAKASDADVLDQATRGRQRRPGRANCARCPDVAS